MKLYTTTVHTDGFDKSFIIFAPLAVACVFSTARPASWSGLGLRGILSSSNLGTLEDHHQQRSCEHGDPRRDKVISIRLGHVLDKERGDERRDSRAEAEACVEDGQLGARIIEAGGHGVCEGVLECGADAVEGEDADEEGVRRRKGSEGVGDGLGQSGDRSDLIRRVSRESTSWVLRGAPTINAPIRTRSDQ
jgi:hypothetical protein